MKYDEIIHGDCITGMKDIPDNSIDCILTDPPYLYLKNQKLDRPYDEVVFFNEVKRVLKNGGFIVMFGRGTSFYRWNTMLANLGFNFKEEIVWDKIRTTSPLLPLSRKHECISVYCKGKCSVNRSKVPYTEVYDGTSRQDIQNAMRIISCVRNRDVDKLKQICDGEIKFDLPRAHKYHVSAQSGFGTADPGESTMKSIAQGCNERDIISIQRQNHGEIHPTQKPVRLLERLLALVTKEGDMVLDPFSGSGSTAVACINTGRHYIGYEIDGEYFEKSMERLRSLKLENKH